MTGLASRIAELVWVPARDRAAPAGGALKRGRGCTLCLAWGLAVMPLAAAAADPIDLVETKSGLQAQFIETVQDRSSYGLTLHFRFVVPEIAGQALEFDQVAADMTDLCTGFALPRLAQTGPQPRQIVISLASAETPFGLANPEITQYFEAFSIQDNRCIWEVI